MEDMGQEGTVGERGSARKGKSRSQEIAVLAPSHLRCPLSGRLMADPAVVASGQTYERAYILRWLEAGNRTCPKTGQRLHHVDVIPNYTVKALIASYCEAEGLPLPLPPQLDQNDRLFSHPFTDENAESEVNGLAEHEGKYGYGNVISPQKNGIFADYRDEKADPSSMEGQRTGEPLQPLIAEGGGGFSTWVVFEEVDPVTHVEPRTPKAGNRRLQTCRPVGRIMRHSTWAPANLVELATGGWDSSELGSPTVSNSLPPPRSGELSPEWQTSPDRQSLATTPEGEVSESCSASWNERNGSTAGGESEADEDGGAATSPLNHTCSTHTTCVSPDDEDIPVEPIVQALRGGDQGEQLGAAEQIRILAKCSMVNRIRIASAGGIEPLVHLLKSENPAVVELAVTALLNVSINEGNKGAIAATGAVDLLVKVLESGSQMAQENAAATLFSLSKMDENKVTIGASGAIPPLVKLLGSGSSRGKKDACMALFMLSIFSANKGKIVRAGAVGLLVQLIELTSPMVDKACAVLSNLASDPEGRAAIVEKGGIPPLVEVLESGSLKGKESACAALLHLSSSSSRLRSMILQEGAIPPLVALTQTGSPRAKEKANMLLKQFRAQRQNGLVRHGSLRSKTYLTGGQLGGGGENGEMQAPIAELG